MELNHLEDEAGGFGQHLEQSWEGAVGTLTSAHLRNSRINSEQTREETSQNQRNRKQKQRKQIT